MVPLNNPTNGPLCMVMERLKKRDGVQDGGLKYCSIRPKLHLPVAFRTNFLVYALLLRLHELM